MRRLGLAIVTAALFSSTSAFAQIIGDIESTPTGSGVNFGSAGFDYKNPPPAGPLPGTGTVSDGGSGHYQTVVEIGDVITFKAENVSSGNNMGTSGATTVGFTFNNPTSETVNFESTIIAAGMGFQIVQPEVFSGEVTLPGCQFWQCAPVPPTTDVGFSSFGPSEPEGVITLGQVGFNFDISDNGESIYNVAGQFNLLYNSDGLFFDDASLFGDGSASALLSGFRTIGDGNTFIGFEWDETAVHFDLVGPTHNLVYTTSVFSFSNAGCIFRETTCLVAYSGFGDPIGRGGGVEALTAFGFDLLAEGDPSAVPGGAVFNRPFYDADTNTLTFASVNAAAVVPEPGAWALMILGFGGIGAAMRRRRLVVA